MIPPFNDAGYLPPGIHPALLAEIATRFGQTGIPFVNMELVDREAFEQFTQKTFATDRDLTPKGMVEVLL
jgi:hypothetical protein